MKCDEFERLMFGEAELTPDQEIALGTHRQSCSRCQAICARIEEQANEAVIEALRDSNPELLGRCSTEAEIDELTSTESRRRISTRQQKLVSRIIHRLTE